MHGGASVEAATRGRVPELDGFRGLAIALVVISHARPAFTADISHSAELLGHLGVLLFFVLSGYLITGLLCREYERTGSVYLAGFYLRRARRLLPALAVLLIGMAVLGMVGVMKPIAGRDFLVAILYVRNIFGNDVRLAHLWSLSLEEQFYTVWPLLFLMFGSQRMRRVALVICAAVMVARGVATAVDPALYETAQTYMRPWFRFDSVAAGCILAFAKAPRKGSQLFWVAAPVLLLWSVFETQLPQEIFLSVQTLLAAWMLWTVIAGAPLIKRMFSAGWLQWLGLISYSLYLWQQLFLITAAGTKVAWMGQFPINVVLAIGMGWISRRFVELPFLKPHAETAIASPPVTVSR